MPVTDIAQAMSDLAMSGNYMDWYAIERQLVALGYTEDEVRHALRDTATRHGLNEQCAAARKSDAHGKALSI